MTVRCTPSTSRIQESTSGSRDGEIAFAHYMDRWVVVRSRDVDWKVFSDVVMHYQNKADRNAEERDKRFSR